jgi:hypothetical protein
LKFECPNEWHLGVFGPYKHSSQQEYLENAGRPANGSRLFHIQAVQSCGKATLTDAAPIHSMALCAEPAPDLPSGEALSQPDNITIDATWPENPLLATWEKLMAQMELPFTSDLDTAGGLSMLSAEAVSMPELTNMAAAVTSMAQMLTTQATVEALGHFLTIKGYETAFSTWTALKSLDETNTSTGETVNVNVDAAVGAMQHFLQHLFENSGASYASTFILLDQAQYQRLLGNYVAAMQKAQAAAMAAPSDTREELAKRVYCMLQLEFIGQAPLIDENTGSGDCLVTLGKSNAPQGKTDATEPAGNQTVAAYPNPTDGMLYLQMPHGSETKPETSIYDLTGRLVLSRTSSTILDISALPSGLYILHIKPEAGVVQTHKIVKQ